MRPWVIPAAVALLCERPLFPRASVPDDAAGPTQTTAEWTREYSARRAAYYLNHAGQMLDQALKQYKASLQGKGAGRPYLKAWDAQSQLSAAVSWDTGSADLWLEAGNLTFTLAGLMGALGEGNLLNDCLSYWAHALELEAAASAEGQRPLAVQLRGWLQQLVSVPAKKMKKSVQTMVLLEVREKAWNEVQSWERKGLPRTRLRQRRMGRIEKQVALSSSLSETGPGTCAHASGADGCGAQGSDVARQLRHKGGWLGAKLGQGKQLVFPTTIYRTNLRRDLGEPFFQKLSEVAAARYGEYSKKMKKRNKGITEYDISNAFFKSQETHERSFTKSTVNRKWPELYTSDEFKTLLKLARSASLAYLNHSGIDVGTDELRQSWLHIWSAVYPQDPSLQGRHGWHTHPESVLSGVFYANPQSTPLLFADPRGAPPTEDYERYKADDLLFEPKAPFDAPYQLHAESGDLVVFPSWLVHKVPPPLHGNSSEHRVAFPFNFHLGKRWDGWERTVSVVC